MFKKYLIFFFILSIGLWCFNSPGIAQAQKHKPSIQSNLKNKPKAKISNQKNSTKTHITVKRQDKSSKNKSSNTIKISSKRSSSKIKVSSTPKSNRNQKPKHNLITRNQNTSNQKLRARTSYLTQTRTNITTPKRVINQRPKNIANQVNRANSKDLASKESRSWFNGAQRNRYNLPGISGKNLKQNAILAPKKQTLPAKTQANVKKKNASDAGKSGDLKFYYRKNISDWSPNPAKPKAQTDESLALEGEHHVRAFTKLDNSKDFDISAGPEFIFKESKQNTTLNKTDQPQSELGLGMHFEYKF